MNKHKTAIIGIAIVIGLGVLIWGISKIPTCTEHETRYVTRSKWGNTYQLSSDLDEAKRMVQDDRPIIKRERCVSYE